MVEGTSQVRRLLVVEDQEPLLELIAEGLGQYFEVRACRPLHRVSSC